MTFEPRTRKRESPLARHIPVLFDQVLEFLRPRSGGRYLDGTVGLGGHALGLLDAAPGSEVLGIDCDSSALEIAGQRLSGHADRVHLVKGRYSEFEAILDETGWDLVDGALLDLGVSSLQLDTAERGFSFIADGPLDMRMDPSGGAAPAASLVNKASYHRLKEIILRYGEDPLAGRIARALVDSRDKNPVRTTLDLAARVSAAYPAKMRAKARNHPATRTFQALRMAVNQELEELEEF
ncbi:MAG: 16S rRNA (cytosine(1402)-N(4))-methyltransferase RsmH, partial [Thermodesulfobacteriota bacterium]|nr:16S rRNA (cytosine(1402)-N(4))-methyltransferase RsmH [Thermodesulfobacteriota bacterium]